MAATITIDELMGTASSFEDVRFTMFEGLAEKNFVRQWSSDPTLNKTDNIQVSELPDMEFVVGKVKTNGDNTINYVHESSSTKELSFYDSLKQKIFYKLVFPSHWQQEGVNKPNITAKSNAFNLCSEIYKKYDLQPDRILSTKEEGVYIVYDCIDSRRSRSLIIEAYNDAEIGVVVCDNDNNEIIYNEDILDLNFENAVRIYKAKTR